MAKDSADTFEEKALKNAVKGIPEKAEIKSANQGENKISEDGVENL